MPPTKKVRKKKPKIVLSEYQQKLMDWAENPVGNIIVNAKAGSGKTSTAIMMMNKMKGMKVGYLCFNKSIQREAERKVPIHVTAVTFHSLLNNILSKNSAPYEIDGNKVANIVKHNIYDISKDSYPEKQEAFVMAAFCSKMIGLLKNHYRAITGVNIDRNYCEDLIGKFDIDVPTIKGDWLDVLIHAYAIDGELTSIMDFDDMIYRPVLQQIIRPQFDVVFIDEAQDTCPVQIESLTQLASKHIIAVGDKFQAIYGWRGAGCDAMDELTKALDAKQYDLSICYRCGSNIIEEAQKIVPGILPFEGAGKGEVRRTPLEKFYDEVSPGDWVLSRLNAPLIIAALRLIKKGVSVLVMGRDIAGGLIDVINKVTRNAFDIGITNFLSGLEKYEAEQRAKLLARESTNQLLILKDKCDVLRSIAEIDDVHVVSDITNKINSLFTESENSERVMFCTVHKSKGLEAEKVFILSPEKMPHPLAKQKWQRQQEKNLKYVAITRAQKCLIYVDGELS